MTSLAMSEPDTVEVQFGRTVYHLATAPTATKHILGFTLDESGESHKALLQLLKSRSAFRLLPNVWHFDAPVADVDELRITITEILALVPTVESTLNERIFLHAGDQTILFVKSIVGARAVSEPEMPIRSAGPDILGRVARIDPITGKPIVTLPRYPDVRLPPVPPRYPFVVSPPSWQPAGSEEGGGAT